MAQERNHYRIVKRSKRVLKWQHPPPFERTAVDDASGSGYPSL
jgi:hypothetical protein